MESEECQGQKERLVSLVQMVVKEFLGCRGQRVFQGKMVLQVMPVHKVFLVCPVLMARKVSVVQRVAQVIQEV